MSGLANGLYGGHDNGNTIGLYNGQDSGLSNGLYGPDNTIIQAKTPLETFGNNLKWWINSARSPMTIGGTSTTISQWYDISGNNRHLTQATVAKQPIITPNAINGTKQVIYFRNPYGLAANVNTNGRRMQVLTSTSYFNFLHEGEPSYVVCVWKTISATNPVGYGFSPIIDNRDVATNKGTTIGLNNAATAQLFSGIYASAGVTVSQMPVSTVITFGQWNILESTFNPGASATEDKGVFNFRSKPTGTTSLDAYNESSGAVTTGNASYSLMVGKRALDGNVNQADMYVAEIFMVSRLPTQFEQLTIRAYLMSEWGLTNYY